MLANYPIYIIVIIIYCMYRLYWYTFQVIQVYDLDRYQDMQLAAGQYVVLGLPRLELLETVGRLVGTVALFESKISST